jgi:hypothetical protein
MRPTTRAQLAFSLLGALLLTQCLQKSAGSDAVNKDVARLARENAQLKAQVEESKATQAGMLADVRDLRERIQAMESKATASSLTVLAPEEREEPAPQPAPPAVNAYAPPPPAAAPPQQSGPKIITIGAPSTSSDQTIRMRCEREWPSDVRMRAYCEEQQERAKRRLETRTPSSLGLSMTDFENIRRACRSEWMDDFKMRDTCERRQAESWRGSRGE